MPIKYVILEASAASSIDFDKVFETSPDTLRWNHDQTKTVVKYDGHKPGFLYGKPTLTNAEILVVLSGSEWASADI